MKTLTPLGVMDFVPEEAQQHQTIVRTLQGIFEANGFKKIKTPALEYAETLTPVLDPQFVEKTIRFFDNQGRLLMLRPDHTAPIARLVAARMQNQERPLKLFYLDPVYQMGAIQSAEPVEVFQAGLEWIGEQGPTVDASVISTCIDAMKALGFTDFGIDIGHQTFSAHMSAEQRSLILAGDYLQLGYIPERGGVEVVQDYPELVVLHSALKAKGQDHYVHFNKSLIHHHDYYTGIVFEVYAKGVRRIIGKGGRYDNLIQQFGYDCPAVGFALNVNVLLDEVSL
ncbi:MAG: ATP phosphoribosyltransferase regulatory subunit [Candidatus Margulisiibacteriota bacterium]